MTINVSTTNQEIQVSTSGQTVNATVSGGQGPQGPAGATGATGPQGPQGATGPAGTTTWAGITDKPATFAPSAHQHPISDVTGLQAALDSKATPADVTAAVAAVVDAAPAALDTLNELAAALGDDANFASTVTTALAGKVDTTDSRLTDARTPTAHVHAAGDITSGTLDQARIPYQVVYPVRVLHVGGGFNFSNGGSVSPVYFWGGSAADLRVLETIDFPNTSKTVSILASATKYISENPGATITYASLEVVLVDAAGRIVGWAGTSTNPAFGPSHGTSGHTMTVSVLEFPSLSPTLWIVGGLSIPGLNSVELQPYTAYRRVASRHIDIDQTDWGNIPNKPSFAAIATSGSASDLTTGIVPIGRISTGSTSTTVCAGNDARLSDARQPLAHKASHATGGSDAIAPADIGAAAASHTHSASDITSGTVATARLPSASTSAAGVAQLSTTAQALAGASTTSVVTPQAMHLSRRGSGRTKFFELFTDFAVNGSGFNAGTDGVLFQPDFTGAGSSGTTNGTTLASFSGRVGAGLYTCTTGTASTGRSGFDSRETQTIFRFDTGTTTLETLVYLPNLADATDDYIFRIGFCQGNALSNDVMCFEYNRSNSANWVGVTGWNGAYNRVTSSVAVSAAKWILLRMVFSSTSAEFFVNDASIGTSSSLIRADGGCRIGCHLLKTAGTTSRTALIDYVYIRHDFNSDRSYT